MRTFIDRSFPIASAEYAKTERISSLVKFGYADRSSSIEAFSEKRLRINSTEILVPLITGFPIKTAGSDVILSR